jgi:hypothetical protein
MVKKTNQVSTHRKEIEVNERELISHVPGVARKIKRGGITKNGREGRREI